LKKSNNSSNQNTSSTSSISKSNKKYSFFDILTSIVNKKNIPQDIIEKDFSPFVAVTWLSNNPTGLLVGNFLNASRGNSKIDNFNSYLFLKNGINLPKNTFIKFPKKQKEEIEKSEILKAISIKYKLSEEKSKEYFEIIKNSDDEIDNLKQLLKGLK